MWHTIKLFVDSSFVPSIWTHNYIANILQHQSVYYGTQLSSSFLLMDSSVLSSRCQVHIGSAALLGVAAADEGTYTYSCQVYEGGENGSSSRSPSRHTDSHHHRHRHRYHRVSSARDWEIISKHG